MVIYLAKKKFECENAKAADLVEPRGKCPTAKFLAQNSI